MNTRLKWLHLSIAALLAFGVTSAHAQAETTVYGRVVAGVDYSTNVSNDGKTSGSRLSAAGNQWGTSMIGFQGSEDLGGGVKAIFDLESGFGAPSGTTNNPALFNRYAFVGLSSSTAGTVKFGNILEISNNIWFLDPMGQQWISTPTLVKGRSWENAPNSVQYESPSFGGFSVNAQYSFGGVAGSNSASTKNGIMLAYVQPTFELRAIYDTVHDASGKFSDIFNTSQELIVGATAKLGDAKLYAAYQSLSAPDSAVGIPNKLQHYWVGLNYYLTPALMLRLADYHATQNNKGATGNLAEVGLDYSLSKRTLLYATFGEIDNGKTGTFSEQYWNPQVPGQNTSSLFFGISHTF